MNREKKTYGDCESPDDMYVKLISSKCHRFIVKNITYPNIMNNKVHAEWARAVF